MKNSEQLRALLFGEENTQPKIKNDIWGDEEDDLFDEAKVKVGSLFSHRRQSLDTLSSPSSPSSLDFKSSSLGDILSSPSPSPSPLFSSSPSFSYNNNKNNVNNIVNNNVKLESNKEIIIENRDNNNSGNRNLNNIVNSNNDNDNDNNGNDEGGLFNTKLNFDTSDNTIQTLLDNINDMEKEGKGEGEEGEEEGFFFDPLLNVLKQFEEEKMEEEEEEEEEEVKQSVGKGVTNKTKIDRIFEMMVVVGIPPPSKQSLDQTSETTSLSPSSSPSSPSLLSTSMEGRGSNNFATASPSKRNILHRSTFNIQNIAQAKVLFSYSGDEDDADHPDHSHRFHLPEKKFFLLFTSQFRLLLLLLLLLLLSLS